MGCRGSRLTLSIGVQGGRSRAARVSAMKPAAAAPRKLPPPTTKTPKTVETTGAPTAAAKRRAPPPPPAAAAVSTTISLLAAAPGLGGAALLAWWAVSFRRAGAMLWMVPAGLVLVGAPLLACLSVVASGREPPPLPPC